jgi:hypothetical protein
MSKLPCLFGHHKFTRWQPGKSYYAWHNYRYHRWCPVKYCKVCGGHGETGEGENGKEIGIWYHRNEIWLLVSYCRRLNRLNRISEKSK